MEWLETLKDIGQVLLYVLITGGGTLIIKKLFGFLNTKIDEAQKNSKLADNEMINKLIDNAQITVTQVVSSIAQTYVDSLKSSGEFNKETATIAKDTAIAKATELLSNEAVSAIETVHGNFSDWLDISIEAAVKALKK
jgi:hypothetical protein